MDPRIPTGGFLSLIPTTSDSYPQQQSNALQQQHQQQLLPAAAGAVQLRRNLSVSTESVITDSGLRFLKLCPVHWGEHLDEDKADWCTVEE